jgi:hypothetical protein
VIYRDREIPRPPAAARNNTPQLYTDLQGALTQDEIRQGRALQQAFDAGQ